MVKGLEGKRYEEQLRSLALFGSEMPLNSSGSAAQFLELLQLPVFAKTLSHLNVPDLNQLIYVCKKFSAPPDECWPKYPYNFGLFFFSYFCGICYVISELVDLGLSLLRSGLAPRESHIKFRLVCQFFICWLYTKKWFQDPFPSSIAGNIGFLTYITCRKL